MYGLTDDIQALQKELKKTLTQRDKLVAALEEIRDLETDCCSRCEGDGRLWADGHTISCGNCGGSGRILPENAQDIAAEAIAESEKEREGTK